MVRWWVGLGGARGGEVSLEMDQHRGFGVVCWKILGGEMRSVVFLFLLRTYCRGVESGILELMQEDSALCISQFLSCSAPVRFSWSAIENPYITNLSL